MEALGKIETKGLVALIEAADAMLKTAKVSLVGIEKTGTAIVSVLVRGSVADCRIAVDAGAAAAHKTGDLLSVNVIPYPHSELERELPIRIKHTGE